MKTRMGMFALIVLCSAMLVGGCGNNVVTPPSGSQSDSQPGSEPGVQDDVPIKGNGFDGRIVMDRVRVSSAIAEALAHAEIDRVAAQLAQSGYELQPRHSLLLEGSFDSELSSMLLLTFLNRDEQRLATMAIAERSNARMFGVSITDHSGQAPIDVPLDVALGGPSEARWDNNQKSDFASCVASRITSDIGSCLFACIVANMAWGGCMLGCVGITGIANVVGCITLVNVRTNMGHYDPQNG